MGIIFRKVYQYYGYEGAKKSKHFICAVTERNIRLIYYKPIKEFKDQHVYVTDVDEYKTMFSNLKDRLDQHDLQFGKVKPMDSYQISIFTKIIMAIGCVAAAILLIWSVLPIRKRWKIVLTGLGTLGVLGAYALMPGLSERLPALLQLLFLLVLLLYF